MLIGLILFVSGCGTSAQQSVSPQASGGAANPSAVASTPSTIPSTQGAPSSSGAAPSWQGMDEEDPGAEDPNEGSAESTPLPGEELTGSPAEEEQTLDEAVFQIDPCSLISPDEFAAWLGQGEATAIVLEDGEACGWKGGDDSVRMAIAVVPYMASAPGRFLPPEITGPQQPLGATAVVQARWVERYPVSQSSVLVVETALYDLVIEMSTRGTRTQDELRLGAIQFADIALGRIP